MNDALPTLVIEPGRRGALSDVLDVWRYRELVYTLAVRDIKVRYRNATLGTLWVLLQPALSALLFYAIFGHLARMPSDGVPYAVFAVAGVVGWLFVSNAVGNAASSILLAAPLIGKVYFPRLIIPLSATAAAIVDLIVAAPLAVGVALFAGIDVLSPALLLVPFFCAGLLLTATGVGTLLCALTVVFRDFRYVIPFTMQLWMYASPIVYPSSLIPDRFRWLYFLNPTAGPLEGFRSAICGTPIPWSGVVISLSAGVAVMVIALRTFAAVERNLVDRL